MTTDRDARGVSHNQERLAGVIRKSRLSSRYDADVPPSGPFDANSDWSPPPGLGTRQPFRVTRPVPTPVRAVFWIVACVVAIELLVLVINQLTFDWDAYLAKSVHSFVRDGHVLYVTPALAVGTIVFAIVVVLTLNAVQLLLGYLVRRGVNWARIVLTLFSVGSILSLLASHNVLISYVDAAAAVAVVVLLWLRPSNQFFSDVKADRSVHKSMRPVALG